VVGVGVTGDDGVVVVGTDSFRVGGNRFSMGMITKAVE